MKRIKLFLWIVLTTSSIFPLYRFLHKQTDGFTPSKIRTAFLKDTIPHLSSSLSVEQQAEIQSILSQPLHYIGRGGQCYAFTTSDQKYVVKLLKYNNNYPKIWFQLFSFPGNLELYRKQILERKQKKLEGEYKSYQIALENLQEETGIIYMHLDAGSLPEVQLELFDKIRVRHHLSADAFQFYIQKKGIPFYPKLETLIQQGQLQQAKIALDEMTAYLKKRCQKQIADKDNGIWRNFAFCEEHPFQIDIGQFVYDPSLSSEKGSQENLLLFTREFRNWLKNLDPTLENYFTQSLSCPEAL
ncbi:MAG: hypothetical protein K2Y01_04660 [Rhabdochlamydiaceae bacterium]|nr:hypothetical protein [Rhabdochlamydiaceae bacterium]